MSRKMTVSATRSLTDAEQHEDVGDHHGREELQEVLHPEVDDPEAPEVRRRPVRVGLGEQADGVERGDGKRGEEEEPRHVPLVLVAEAYAQDAPEHEDPGEEADREQDLPEPPE